MIYELRQNEYENVRSLYDGLNYHLVIYSIIEGNSPGVVYVDAPNEPKTAFMWDKVEGGFYLAGDESNCEFNKSLNEWILNRIYPAVNEIPHLADFALYYFPEAWADHVNVILKDTDPMKHYRKHFIIDQLKYDWKSLIPDGFRMIRVDGDFLKRKQLKNIGHVTGWVMSSWGSLENFMEKGFGFCLVHENDIVSWSIADYVAGKDYEIGIHTDENYRRRGFATMTAAAAVDYCLSNGMEHVGWHCWSPNLGSAATAKKVGFRQTIEHPIYHAWYNKFDNLLVKGHFSLERGNFREGAEFYEEAFRMWDNQEGDSADSRMFADEKSRGIYYYSSARSWALADEAEYAIRNLKKAVENGWTDARRTEEDTALKGLHSHKEWDALILSMEGKQYYD